MFNSYTFLFLSSLLFVSFLIEPIVKKLRIPFSIILVLMGFIGSEITTHLFEIDTGIRWHNFQTIIFYIILPTLIFQAALKININLLLQDLFLILVMALPLMLLAVIITAAILYYGIGHATGFPWIAALLAGALLSATDPTAVLSFLERINAPERLRILLEGESLFNDAAAIVVFSILLAIALDPQESSSFSMLTTHFSQVLFGGLLVGVVFGLFLALIFKLLSSQSVYVLISIISAYSVFIVSNDILNVSGVIAVLICGITISLVRNRDNEKPKEDDFFESFWSLLQRVASAMIFLLGGITITVSMFTERWLAMLVAIIAVIAARFVVIMGSFSFMSLLPGVKPVSLKHQGVLVLAGDRGTVTLALALSLPLTLDYYFTIQSSAYGVVVFTLLFQAAILPLFLKKKISLGT